MDFTVNSLKAGEVSIKPFTTFGKIWSFIRADDK